MATADVLLYYNYVQRGHERHITQFHFTKWPDHGTPDAVELVMFHRQVQRAWITQQGPLAVHCRYNVECLNMYYFPYMEQQHNSSYV